MGRGNQPFIARFWRKRFFGLLTIGPKFAMVHLAFFQFCLKIGNLRKWFSSKPLQLTIIGLLTKVRAKIPKVN